MKRLIHILFYTLFPLLLNGQIKNIGSPNIRNYPKSVYRAGTQNWGITQDQNGFMYFANNEGVLIFDGMQWNQVVISQTKPIRSIFTDSNNNIYIGLLNDFGTLLPSENGMLSYRSLRHLLPSTIKDFDDIWRIYETPEGIIFQTFEYLFIFRGGMIIVLKPKNRFHFSFNVNGKIFLHEPGTGVFEYTNNFINEVPWSDQIKDEEIWEILEADDGNLLICTSGSGMFKIKNGNLIKWDSPVNELVIQNKLYSAKKIIGNNFAFGTILNGLIISDVDGNIIQHINKNNGLQNNTVLSLFSDNNDNLWIGLDNGIDYVEINSPISYLTNFEGIGTGYCTKVFDNNLYLGTNQGLFVKAFNNPYYTNEKFELVKNTAGQVWSLFTYEGQLYCGHNSGTYRIVGKEAEKISNVEGAWKFIPLQEHPDLLLGGHYNGLVLLKKGEIGMEFYKKIYGFNESSRFLQQDNKGNIWVSHGAKGVFKIILNAALDSVESYRHFTSGNGLPSDEQNIVFHFDDEILISTIDGIFVFNETSDMFQKSEKFNAIFNLSSRLKTFETDNSGNIWYIAENESGVLRLNQDSTYTKILSPFRQLDGKYVNEFEFIYPHSNEHLFLGIDNGFAHYSSNLTKSYSKSYKSFVTKIELPYIDSTIYYSRNAEIPGEFNFPYKKNSFRFFYTATFYENTEPLEFSYFLENYSDQWSGWSTAGFKDFTNLREGDYVFRLKAKNIYEVESEVSEFSFSIDPPWQRSKTAYYIYTLLLVIISILFIKFMQYRIILSRRKEEARYQKELQEKEKQFQTQAIINEKEIIRLRNEKLRAEMVHRDKELANQTMNIIQKNKILLKLKEELDLIQKSTDNPDLRTKILIINRRLDKEIDNKQQSNIFETYFEEVHEDFFRRLKEKHPNLSPRDLNLSAYIRMNLSTKEIAALLNITNRGVEIGRYRLRKKLDIPRDINLSTYLSNI